MTEYIDFPKELPTNPPWFGRGLSTPDDGERYGTIDELKRKILFKKIVKFTMDYIVLDDGTTMTVELSDWDCCAYGEGFFKNVKLDAMITDIKLVEVPIDDEYHDEVYEKVCVNILHNQNIVAEAEAEAGHNGFYLSVVSLVIDNIHFPIISI